MRIAIEVLKCLALVFVVIRKVITMPPTVAVVLVTTGGLVGASWYIWLAIEWMHARWVAYRTGSIIPDEVIVQEFPEVIPSVRFDHPEAN